MKENISKNDFDLCYEVDNYEKNNKDYDEYVKENIEDNAQHNEHYLQYDNEHYLEYDNENKPCDYEYEKYSKCIKYDDNDIYYTKFDDSFYNNNLDSESYSTYQKIKSRILELENAIEIDFDNFELADRNDYLGQIDDNKELIKVFYKLAIKNSNNQDIRDRLDIKKYKQTLSKECEIQISQERDQFKKKTDAFVVNYKKNTDSMYEQLKAQHDEYHSQVENLREVAEIFRNYIDEIKKYTYSMSIEQISRRIRYIESKEKLILENQKELDKLKIALKNRKPDSSSQRLTDNLKILESFDEFHHKYLSFVDPSYICTNKNKMKFATIDDFDNLIDTYKTPQINNSDVGNPNPIINIDNKIISAEYLLDFKKYDTDPKKDRRFKYLKEKQKNGTITQCEISEYEQWTIYINNNKKKKTDKT